MTLKENIIYLIAYLRKSTENDERQMLSIPAQKTLILEYLKDHPNIIIIDWVIDQKSAMRSGNRPKFRNVLDRVYKGEADGFICWKPHRSARNRTEGGEIVDSLRDGRIKNVLFTNFPFENTADGRKQLMDAYNDASHYSENLGEEVNKGYRIKPTTGWKCASVLPLGYLNFRVKAKMPTVIIDDPARYSLVKQAWQLMILGAHSVDEIGELAYSVWGLRSLKNNRVGRSTWYRIFADPFYYGYLEGAPNNTGKHNPMITKEEFDLVQTRLGKRRSRSKKVKGRNEPEGLKDLPYRESIICGKCGHYITIEDRKEKKNKVYYHCAARSQKSVLCKERAIDIQDLESQMEQKLSKIVVPPQLLQWFSHNYLQHINKEITELTDELSRHAENSELIDQREKRLRKMKSCGDYDTCMDEYNDAMNECLSDKSSIEKQVIETNDRISKLKSICDIGSFNFADDLVKTYKQLKNNNEKTDLLLKLAEPKGMTLKDKLLQITFRKPFNS